MRKLSVLSWLSAVLLAACGGGDGSSTLVGSTTGTGTTATTPVASVTVSSSSTTIAPDGSNSATITAIVRDASNNFISGATVTFGSNAGGLAVTQGTTDASGTATATLTASGAAVGTAITVTASTGGQSGHIVVNVANAQQTISIVTSAAQIPSNGSQLATITALVRGPTNQFLSGVAVTFTATSGGLAVTQATTNANGAATATLSAAGDPTNRLITVTATAGSSVATVPVYVVGTNLTISGPPTLIAGSQASYQVALTDSGSGGIPGETVTLKSTAGNTLSASSVTTDATGHGTVTLTGTVAGSDTLTAGSLGLTATTALSVSNQSFVITAPVADAKVNLGLSQAVSVTWTSSGVAQSGQTVNFSSTRGTLSAATAVTNASGVAAVTISSAAAGPAIVTASASGVNAQVSIDFVATTPTQITVQPSPTTVQTQGQSNVTAIVRDAGNNLVEGQTVDFQLTDVTGGSLSAASAVTNDQGQAQVVYTAGSTSSATNGVTIAATVQGTSVTNSATLTVGGQTVFLSLGTGNTITPASDTQYSVDYSVQAIDASGNAVNGATISFAVTSLGYYKGNMDIYHSTSWLPPEYSTLSTDPDAFTVDGTTGGCKTEDLLGNGILTAGEDYNNNQKLDPGLVASASPGSVVTANGGSGVVTVTYPKDHAYWVAVKLTATATVQGTQASTSTSFILAGLAADYTSQTIAPPGQISPYGQATTCANSN